MGEVLGSPSCLYVLDVLGWKLRRIVEFFTTALQRWFEMKGSIFSSWWSKILDSKDSPKPKMSNQLSRPSFRQVDLVLASAGEPPSTKLRSLNVTNIS